MADFRIENVKINPGQSWQDVSQHQNWQAVKSADLSWEHINQIAEINQPVLIEVEVVISSWDRIRSSFGNWQTIKNTINTWSVLKTY